MKPKHDDWSSMQGSTKLLCESNLMFVNNWNHVWKCNKHCFLFTFTTRNCKRTLNFLALKRGVFTFSRSLWDYYIGIGHIQKKVPFLAKAWHWCRHLNLDCSKFDLSSWMIPSVPVNKLKDWSSQFWRFHRKQTNHSGDIAIFFTVIFMVLVERKCILQKWYSFTYHSN